jgi:ABC-type glycerol-3-phosphate transport system permease component
VTAAIRPPRRRRRNWGFVRPILLTISLLLIVFWSVAPILWIVIMSVQKEINYISTPMQLKLSDVDLHWYQKVLQNDEYRRALKNSVIISTSTMVCCLILGSLAAYPLARLRLPRKNLFIIVVVAIHMLPGIALIIPVFLLVRQLHLYDTYSALIVVHTAFLLPYTIWMLKTFFERIPVALESAARMDGCSRLGALFRVVIPISAPGVVATAVYIFIGSWNEFLFGLVLTSRVAKPVMVTLAEFTGSDYLPDMSQVAAAGVISVIPVIVLALLLNRFIIRGMVEGIKS